ncbi:MAG: hypothetical protein M1838_004921 [Thelocarpon superellum]|nr:MAG: hypothetical protein M1838_004921 [Thelocarpon superellum]
MSSPSAPDIITYIGVPLAVLGVLPIIYTCIRALFTLSGIKRELRRNGLKATTRGSLMSGIVEIELPRYSITPLERHDPAYWELAEPPSLVRGGSWTKFHWDRLATGHTLYRLQYKDELRQPQAEVDFEELVAFLLDRGAVPSAEGFRMLRTTGLWTPTGTKLLLSPDTIHSVLKVAPTDDSDGSLSLSLTWHKEWNNRDLNSLPPYWMRLEAPGQDEHNEQASDAPLLEPPSEKAMEVKEREVQSEATSVRNSQTEHSPRSSNDQTLQEKDPDVLTRSEKPTTLQCTSVRFRIGPYGIQDAYQERQHVPTMSKMNVGHLRAYSGSPPPSVCEWFASAATVIGGKKGMGLWSYVIPEAIQSFALKDTVPCGVMVMLGVIAEEDTPEWATKHVDRTSEKHFEAFQAQTRARSAEDKLPPALAAIARQARQSEELAAFHNQSRQRIRERAEREELRQTEALNSPRLDTQIVADANIKWLHKSQAQSQSSSIPQSQSQAAASSTTSSSSLATPPSTLPAIQASHSMRKIVEDTLYSMIFDEGRAVAMTEMLEKWKAWSDAGGMNKAQFSFVKGHQRDFALASCILALIREVAKGSAVNPAADMQEALRHWIKVRIG